MSGYSRCNNMFRHEQDPHMCCIFHKNWACAVNGNLYMLTWNMSLYLINEGSYCRKLLVCIQGWNFWICAIFILLFLARRQVFAHWPFLWLLFRFLWRKNATFAISRHYKRFDVFVEAEANKAAKKYDNASIDFQIEFYKNEGLTPYTEAKLPIISGMWNFLSIMGWDAPGSFSTLFSLNLWWLNCRCSWRMCDSTRACSY